MMSKTNQIKTNSHTMGSQNTETHRNVSQQTFGLTTKRALIAGDVIQDWFLPLVKIIVPQFKGHYCDNCMNNSEENLKKCKDCRQMYYCNKSCQKNDWKYHKNECPILQHKKFKPNLCIPSERLLIRLWLNIKSLVTTRHQLFDGSDLCLNDVVVKREQLAKDIDRMIEFHMICTHFKDYGIEFESKQLIDYYGLVVYNTLYHSLLYHDYDLIRTDVGIGIYIETYLLNHSCTPNAAVINNGFKLQIRAMKSIGIGEQITLSYLDLAKDKSERQRILKSTFYSECNCDKCHQNLDSDIDYQKFLCDLHQIYSISNFGEMFGETYLSSINKKNAFKLFGQMSGLYCRVYGEYHPTLTAILMQQLLAMYRLTKRQSTNKFNSKIIKQFYTICENNIRVTHGVDHYYYDLFLVVRHYLGRAALRNSDQRLVPAIIACNFSVCFLLFGVFLTISGVIFRSIAASSQNSFPSQTDPSQTAVTVGTVILSIGSVLAAVGLTLLIFAWISFKRFEAIRSTELRAANSAVNLNYETSFTNAVHYPPPTAYSQSTDGYRTQPLYTIQDEFEPPPSYSTLPHSHEVVNQSDK